MSRGGAEREWDTESEAGSRLWAVSTEPDAGLELIECEIMTWAEVRRLSNWATQVPLKYLTLNGTNKEGLSFFLLSVQILGTFLVLEYLIYKVLLIFQNCRISLS